MTLRRKILLGYGITLALMGVVLVWALFNLVHLGQAGNAILRENYASILSAENMIEAIERQDSATLLVMLGYQDEGLRQFRENENSFLQWLARARDNITVRGEADVLESIDAGYSAYLVAFSELCARRAEDSSKAGPFYHETVLPGFKHVRDAAIRLRQLNQDTMFATSRRAERVAHTAFYSTVSVAGGAIVVGLLFGLLLSSRIVRPIRQMMSATEALAEGDYDVRVPVGGSDELGRLARSFNAMSTKLGIYHRLNVEQILAGKQKADAVLRSIEDGVIVVDAELRIDSINPPAGCIIGVDPEAAAGRHFLEVFKEERLFALVRSAAESGEAAAIEEGQNIICLKSGDAARHYMFAITPVLSKTGAMQGVVLLLRDVTRLKELDRMKSEFVMTASHELKTPLHSLGMSIQLLREGAALRLDEKQRQLLDAAHEEIERLGSLVNDLLDLSRLEAGRVEMELDAVPVWMLAEKAVGVLAVQARQRGAALTMDVPGDAPDVRADANKIVWVLTNLIGNALRYVDQGGHVLLAVRQIGQWVHFSVADDGEGIPPEYQSRIFEKFVQVKTERSAGGTGLGLTICKEIVRAHRGTIWVESAPGRGSKFTFTLPVADRS